MLPDPPNFDELRQIGLLAEAVLLFFAATPAALAPFGQTTLRWDVRMPTTVIPEVHVELHLYDGLDDRIVDPAGARVVAPYGDTLYLLYLKTPLAARQLGTLAVKMDFVTCETTVLGGQIFEHLVKEEADRTFPAAGQVTLRGDGSKVDIGIDSFVVDIPVEADVPNWFDAKIDVTLGFAVSSEHGQLRVANTLARTKVEFGTLSAIFSHGCTVAVAAALEAQSDGFLSGLVGPVIAERLARTLTADIEAKREGLNTTRAPISYKFYGLTLTQDALTYRFCPAVPLLSSATHNPIDGVIRPVHD